MHKLTGKITIGVVLVLLFGTCMGNNSTSSELCRLYSSQSQVTLDCSNRNLYEIPYDIPKNTTQLSLYNNRITEIKNGSFDGLANLTQLYLHSNRITEISSGYFEGLANLVTLDLGINYITNIKDQTFLGLSRLIYLLMDSNRITEISSGSFEGLANLLTLTLHNNRISEISSGSFEGLASLVNLDISNNIIKYIDGYMFYRLHSLQTLYFYGNPLTCSCNVKSLQEWVTLRSVFVFLAKCENSTTSVMDYNDFDSCSEEDSLFTKNLKCFDCNTMDGHMSCEQQNTLISCNSDDAVCYSNITFNDNNNITITKGCASDSLCHQWARENKLNNCFNNSESRTCAFCCLKNYCNGENMNVYCLSSHTIDSKGVFAWAATAIGAYAESNCYNVTNEMITVYRKCVRSNGRAIWRPPDTTDCREKSTSLEDLDTVIVTEDNADIYSEDLVKLSSQSGEINKDELALSVSCLEKLLSLNSSFSSDKRVDNIIKIMDNTMRAPQSSLSDTVENGQAATRIFQMIDKFIESVVIKGETFKKVGTKFGLIATKVNETSYQGLSVNVQSLPGKDIGDENVDVNAKVPDNVRGSWLQLPLNLIQEISPALRPMVSRLTFKIFTDDRLFKAMKRMKFENESDLERNVVNSFVLAASIPGVRIQNLSEPVKFRFIHNIKNAIIGTCAYFVEEGDKKGQWSQDGCRVTKHSEELMTYCECDHMTNFALIMDIYNIREKIPLASLSLQLVSYIGCGLSLVGLILTILTYSVFRSLRKTKPAIILMNLCTALALTNFIFLFGEQDYSLKHDVGCKVVAVCLHYSLLAVMMWLLVEGFYFYIAIIRVLHDHIQHFYLKICVFGWGLPLVIVIITIASTQTDSYGLQGGTICWLDSTAFYITVSVPFAAMVLCNTVIYVLVIRRILGTKVNKSKSSDKVHMIQRVRGSVTAVVMLGLTWILALFVINNETVGVVFQYLFSIFNSLQGFFIFIFHCLLKTEVQSEWKKKLTSTCKCLEGITTVRMSKQEYALSDTEKSDFWTDERYQPGKFNAVDNPVYEDTN